MIEQLNEIKKCLKKVSGPDKNGWYTALCPFHNDQHTPNLRFTEKGFYCLACGEKGSLSKLANKLGITSYPGSSIGRDKKISAVYGYKDENGKLLFQVVRYTPKTFKQRRPDGKGSWIYNLKGVTPTLYQLPELLKSPLDETIFIAEGEKGVESLIEHGLTATCSPMGAGKWRDEYSYYFTSRKAIVLPDNDETGRRHAEQVASSLYSITKEVKVLDLPNLSEKEDVYDWFTGGGTKEKLLELVLSTPPYTPPEQIDLSLLLDDVSIFIRRYVVLSVDQLVAVALWVVHTYSINHADTTPYLNIHSAEKRSGKTRLLEVLEVLVASPWLTGRVTSAVLARKIDAECPTLLLDESDAAFKGEKEYSEMLRGILNSGYRRGGKSSICVGKGADIGYKDLSTFCPKAIAGIGKLPSTIADRSIPILLKRKIDEEKTEKFRLRRAGKETEGLREQLELCRSLKLTGEEVVIPEELDDRAADCCEPLLVMARYAGEEWSTKATEALISLMTGEERQDDSLNVQLLSDIREILESEGLDRISSSALTDSLKSQEESPWCEHGGINLSQRKLSKMLKPYGIKSKPIRSGVDVYKGYQKDDFNDAFSRYLPINPLLRVTSVTTSYNSNVEEVPVLSVTNSENNPNVTDNLQSYANRNVTDVTDKSRNIRKRAVFQLLPYSLSKEWEEAFEFEKMKVTWGTELKEDLRCVN
jgi:DNA primase (bacterial type)